MEKIANFVFEKRTEIKNNLKEQFFVNELRHHYNLRNPKGCKPTMVFLVVRVNGRQVKVSTGMKTYPKYWQVNHAIEDYSLPIIENNNNKLLNEKIKVFDSRFEEYKRLVNDGLLTLDEDSLRCYLYNKTTMVKKKEKSEPINIASVILSYLNKDTTIKDSTKSNYTRHLKKFEEFLSFYTIKSYSDLTQKMMKDFQQWCVDNVKGRQGNRASGQSINAIVEGVFKCIKSYLVNNGLFSGSQFADIQIEPLKEVNIDDEIALRDDELTLLYNYQCLSKRDEEIRDLFLLECTTAQRFSDVEKVDDLIEHKDGRTYFNLVQDKGGAKVQVDVIFQMALDILEKYSYRLPTHNKKIFNKRIKEIAKNAGINGIEQIRYHEANIAGISYKTQERWECISSHTGRRTFITMLSLRGYNETEIARYSGHETLEMVRRYDKSKEGTKFKEMFDRLKIEHPECVLKMVKETDSCANTILTNGTIKEVIELAQESERKNTMIENLHQSLNEANDKIRQVKHSGDIDCQIKDIISKSEKEEKELLLELMKMGYSYDDYLKYQQEMLRLESEIDIADSHHDTFLDD